MKLNSKLIHIYRTRSQASRSICCSVPLMGQDMTQDEVLVFKSFQYFKSRFVEGVEERIRKTCENILMKYDEML